MASLDLAVLNLKSGGIVAIFIAIDVTNIIS